MLHCSEFSVGSVQESGRWAPTPPGCPVCVARVAWHVLLSLQNGTTEEVTSEEEDEEEMAEVGVSIRGRFSNFSSLFMDQC